MKKNLLFILLDGCEFNIFENSNFASKIAPNISSLITDGILKKIVTNGMITQVSLPSILTQTYPLDYKGYNMGIKNRPKSIIELFKEEGFHTAFIAGHDITGPRRSYERGAKLVKSIYDFDDTIYHYIRLIIYHEIKKYDQKKISEVELVNILQKDFAEVLNYALNSTDRVDHSSMPCRLKKPNIIIKNKIKKELTLLRDNPLQVLEKLKKIPAMFYLDFLGENKVDLERINLEKKLKIKYQWYDFKIKFNIWFKKITKLGFSPFPIYLSPVASEIIREVKEFLINKQNKPWFVFMQFMDNHDGPKTSRFFNFIHKLKFIPFLYKLRKEFPTHRDFWRDLSLIYLDKQIGSLISDLKKMKKFDDTIFCFFGDHGMGWDSNRDISSAKNLGLRTFFEHLEVPLIVSPCELKPSTKGVHDGMSISATLIKIFKLRSHSSFRGKTIFEPGKKASIVESVGRGNCDLGTRDIYFTITSKKYKIMFVLEKNKLFPVMMFDKEKDPHEYKNLLKMKVYKREIDELANFLVMERKNILLMRKVDIKKIINRKYKWIVNLSFLKEAYVPPQSYHS